MAAGVEQRYAVRGLDRYDNERDDDLTDRVDLSIDPVDPSTAGAGSCTTSGCTATKTGDYRVTATVVGTKISGRASLHVVPGPLDHLALDPGEATVGVDARRPYRAEGADAYGNSLGDYTTRTDFSIKEPDGSCSQDGCGATKAGDYTVIGRAIGTDVTGTATGCWTWTSAAWSSPPGASTPT